MKKRMTLSLLALVFVLGLSGTLIHAKGQFEAEKEERAKETVEQVVIGFEPGDTASPAPTITGEKDWDVYQGEELDVLAGVTAKDYQNKKVKVTASKFSTEEVGTHRVLLTAEDESKYQSTEEITVHVKEHEQVPAVEVTEELVVAENLEQPVDEEVGSSATETESVPEVYVAPQEPTWAPYTMYLGGIAVSYHNAGQGSGQGVIDSNPNVVATWGGAAFQSGNDGANTHFIGHNPGIFSILFALGGGSEIIVTDGAGVPTSYYVNQILEVDDYATRMDNGHNISETVIGAGGGERIVLQTCINDAVNLIVMASAA